MKYYHLVFIIFLIFSCKKESVLINENEAWTVNKDGEIDVFLDEPGFSSIEAKTLNFTGIEFLQKEDFNNAEANFLKALTVEPGNPTVLNNLGNMEKRKKNYDKSKIYYEKSLIASDSLYYSPALNLAVIDHMNENYPHARKLLEFVISNSSNASHNAIAYLLLCDNYLSLGECEKAKTVLKKSENLFKTNEILIEKFKYLEAKILRCFR